MKREKPNSTYVISVVLIIAIVIWGVLAGDSFQAAGTAAFSFLSGKFGWFYVLAMTSFVVYAIWLGFLSPYKRIPLGPDGSRPEYSNLSWFGMLFSAGMGIGLVFWGVAEPLTFWAAPPGFEPGSAEAARFAFQKVFLHWGLHPWAAYSVLALAMAYFQFRKGKPGLISSIFIPLLGEKGARGPIGKIIDILAVFATAAGIATSLGLGAMQINSGLNHVFGVPKNNLVVFLIVAIITVVYIWTALAGVDNGIKKVCDLNIIIAGVVLLLVFLVGPTVDILKSLVESLGYYVGTFPQSAMQMGAFAGAGDAAWYGKWTVFYWAWWIAWAPFTAVFIARISKGRTIKEFVTGVLFLPAGASFVWFSVFGNAGIHAGLDVAKQAIQSVDTALFVVLDHYPLGKLISVVVIVLLCTFFITSANSATFVLGMLSSEGNLNPSNRRKFIWGVLQAALALVLMLCTENGLNMLQTISIVAAFPFAFILLFGMVSLTKALGQEKLPGRRIEAAPAAPEHTGQ